MHNSVEGVSDFQAIHAFKQGVRYRELSSKLARAPNVDTLGRLMEITNKYTNGEEELWQKIQQHRGNSGQPSKGNNQRGRQSGKRKAEAGPSDAELVAAANASSAKGRGPQRRDWKPRQKKSLEDED